MVLDTLRMATRRPCMHPQPSPSWYVLANDGAPPVRLLTDAGRADPALRATPHARLATLAEAIQDFGVTH